MKSICVEIFSNDFRWILASLGGGKLVFELAFERDGGELEKFSSKKISYSANISFRSNL